MAIKEDVQKRAPRGTKNVTQAFFTALDDTPDGQRAVVGAAALVAIRDELKGRRVKIKEAAAAARAKAKRKAPARAKVAAKAPAARGTRKAAPAKRAPVSFWRRPSEPPPKRHRRRSRRRKWSHAKPVNRSKLTRPCLRRRKARRSRARRRGVCTAQRRTSCAGAVAQWPRLVGRFALSCPAGCAAAGYRRLRMAMASNFR